MDNLINRLQWRHLKLVHAIGQTGQLSAAADRLAITQPAGSRMLAEVEKMVGQTLFDRGPKGLTPTPVGKILMTHAGELIRGLTSAAAEVAAFNSALAGTVRIGAVTGAAVAFVVPAVQQLQRETQDADIHVDVRPSEDLMKGLMRGDYDFVLSRIPLDWDTRGLDVLHGKAEVVHFMMRAGHHLLEKVRPSLHDLAAYNWVTQSARSPMRQAVQEAFIVRGIDLPPQIVNTSSLLVMIAYLKTSDFIGPVSSEVADLFRGNENNDLRSIQSQESIIISPYHLIQRKGFEPIPISKRFREILVDTMF